MTLLHPEPAIPHNAEFTGWDTETDASPAQRLVCVAIGSDLYHANDAARWVSCLQKAVQRGYLVAQNVAFDLIVIRDYLHSIGADASWIIDGLRAGKFVCTQRREELIGIASPLDMGYVIHGLGVTKRQFGLDGQCQRYLGTEPMDKGDDGWRMRYGELLPFPVDQWPERARAYALDDVKHLVPLMRAQRRKAPRHPSIGPNDLRISPDEAFQVRASYALESMSRRGMGVDAAHASRLKEELDAEAQGHRAALLEAGLMKRKWKTKNPEVMTKNAKECRALVAAAFDAEGQAVPRTDKGTPKTDAGTLAVAAAFESAPDALVRWSKLTTAEKMVKTYIAPVIAAHAEDHPIQSRYHTLKETGRTSSSGPNVQNLPRRAGMREIYCARPGMALVAADYDTAELRGLGQVCLDLFGESRFAEFYQEDPAGDPHCKFAADVLDDGTTYAQILEAHQAGTLDGPWADARQSAKGVNFGAPGGLGASAMVDYLAGYGINVSEGRAKELLGRFKESWGLAAYFRWASDHRGAVTQTFSGRRRGGTGYCQRANTMFQGLIADAAKQALWDVETEKRDSWGLWCYVHDEIILEVPVAEVDAAANWLVQSMERGASRWIPDVPMRAGAHAMLAWSKKAREIRNRGRLVPDPATARSFDR